MVRNIFVLPAMDAVFVNSAGSASCLTWRDLPKIIGDEAGISNWKYHTCPEVNWMRVFGVTAATGSRRAILRATATNRPTGTGTWYQGHDGKIISAYR